MKRLRVGETLAVEEVLCLPAGATTRGLLADPSGTTAVLLLPSPVRGARGAEIGALWFRLSDGEILAERALPPYSEAAVVVDGPLLVSSHDPDLHDGRGPTDTVLTAVDLSSGDRVELAPDLVGGHLRGLYRAERDEEEVLLVVRQPDVEIPSFEVVRIDLASAFPRSSHRA